MEENLCFSQPWQFRWFLLSLRFSPLHGLCSLSCSSSLVWDRLPTTWLLLCWVNVNTSDRNSGTTFDLSNKVMMHSCPSVQELRPWLGMWGSCSHHWVPVWVFVLATWFFHSLLTFWGTGNLSCLGSHFLLWSTSRSGGEMFSYF